MCVQRINVVKKIRCYIEKTYTSNYIKILSPDSSPYLTLIFKTTVNHVFMKYSKLLNSQNSTRVEKY